MAKKYGYKPEQVICGAGETEIISWIVRVFSAARRQGLDVRSRLSDLSHDGAERGPSSRLCRHERRISISSGTTILAAITDDVRIVFLTNPHSPTGRLIPEARIREVCKKASKQLVVLDEAYIHFSGTEGGIHLVKEFPNLIVLRTFSKVFGLAGLRVGFGIADPEIIKPMMHLKPTWNMGSLQVSGAIAALDDDEHVTKTVAAISEMRAYVLGELGKLNRFSVVGEPSSNFFLLRIEDERAQLHYGVRGAAEARRDRQGRLGVVHRSRQQPSSHRRQPEEADGPPDLGADGHQQFRVKAMAARVSDLINGERLWQRLLELAQLRRDEQGRRLPAGAVRGRDRRRAQLSSPGAANSA